MTEHCCKWGSCKAVCSPFECVFLALDNSVVVIRPFIWKPTHTQPLLLRFALTDKPRGCAEYESAETSGVHTRECGPCYLSLDWTDKSAKQCTPALPRCGVSRGGQTNTNVIAARCNSRDVFVAYKTKTKQSRKIANKQAKRHVTITWWLLENLFNASLWRWRCGFK